MNIINHILTSPTQKRKKAGRKTNSLGADYYLRYCTKCNYVWETNTRAGGNSKYKIIIYHEDFPTFGKKRELCKKCK